MTQEEKAEAYDKVREIIAIRFGSNVAEEIFSKFKDSKNEKIRKAIINIFATHKDYEVYFGVSVEDIRVWLDKQSEQKPEKKELKQIEKPMLSDFLNAEYERGKADALQSIEWNEEDESMYTRTLGILGKCYMGKLPTKVEEELNWFKTLKERIGR